MKTNTKLVDTVTCCCWIILFCDPRPLNHVTPIPEGLRSILRDKEAGKMDVPKMGTSEKDVRDNRDDRDELGESGELGCL